MNDKITHFTQSTFELESFKAILVEIFPQIHFIEPNKRTLPHSILKSQTAICENFKLSNKNFGIYIFECESIRAKVGIHTELKSILKHAGLDAILAIFHTPHSPSLAHGDSESSPSLAEGVRGWVNPNNPSLQTNEASVAIQNKSIDCHEDSTNPLAMTKKVNSKIFDENDNRATQRGSILDETQRVASETKQKSWLRSHERENKTKASIDEASGKIHDLSLKDNASTEFRLSLITSGYDYELNKPTYSNLKRQSFILGHTKTATAQKALAELIKKAQKSPLTQSDLEEAFSQEPVSKEFYEHYKKHYDAICAKLTQANIAHIFANYKGISDSHKAIESFAKKLLGRIVFLYFLQKKGYLGVPRDKSYGEGDTNFLHNLFCKARQQNINFYSEYLSPLFFDSLNARKEDDYSALFDCKIPFLNGGLFEDEFANNKSCHIERSEISKTSICHTEALAEVSQVSQNRDISVSTKPQYDNATIFRANKAHFIIAQVLDNPTFEAIFDFFESYNFTIEESTPTDIEVSIDPEMLGKVFENLIDYNKESGAFYTPREIVHYMAQSALIAHFSRHYPSHKEQIQNLIANKQSDNDFIHKNGAEIKAILLNLKILDPAIGSGAFPMGILSEIMQVLETLDKTMSDAQKAQHKRDIIANCIYGIDIDADAIAIARLRFWLSIAVDEVSPSPLPNLDFKFMQGNSLLESLSVGKECIEIIPRDFMREIPSTKLFDENADKIIFSHDIAKSLQNLFLDYYAQNDAHKKHTLKSQIKSIMSNAFEVRIAQIQKDIDSKTKELSTPNNDKTKKRLTKEIDSLLHQIPALQSLADDFITNDFHTDKVFLYNFFFANVINEGGFDIVIGNPPYGAKIDEPQKQKFKNAYKHAKQGTLDTYKLFIEKGFDLLAQNGNLSYIVPLSVTSSKSNIALHKMLLENCEWIEVSNYGNAPARIFPNADQRVSIINFAKTHTKAKNLFTTKVNLRHSTTSIAEIIDKLHFIDSLDFIQNGAFCKIGLPIEKSIMQKLYAQTHTLKDAMNGDEQIYYRDTGGRYYDLYTSYSTTESTTQKSFAVSDSKALVALMSSTLFWWFRNAYSEGRHSYVYEFERFPIPTFSDKVLKQLCDLGEKYESDIEKNADFSNGVKTYKLRKSKHIIDEIDRLICPLYDLSDEETDFIINYDIAFRTD
ncbi:Eco57I restriction-modification methylase domain-containing protein [Helicobacter sp. 23-1046]